MSFSQQARIRALLETATDEFDEIGAVCLDTQLRLEDEGYLLLALDGDVEYILSQR